MTLLSQTSELCFSLMLQEGLGPAAVSITTFLKGNTQDTFLSFPAFREITSQKRELSKPLSMRAGPRFWLWKRNPQRQSKEEAEQAHSCDLPAKLRVLANRGPQHLEQYAAPHQNSASPRSHTILKKPLSLADSLPT